MSDDNVLKIDSTIRDSLEYYDKNREKYHVFFDKAKYVRFVDNNNNTDDIIFYDENKKILLESSFEIMGLYLPKNNMWRWSWSIPSIHKKYTFISRKILEYAFNLHHTTEYPLRSDLINSKIKINNDLQLDIRIALSSYIGKQPLIFKFYNKIDGEHFQEEEEEHSKNNKQENKQENKQLDKEKQTDIFFNSRLKKYTTGGKDNEETNDEQFYMYVSDDNQSENNEENYMIMYLFILDYENINI
jgi:hypothetical protein